MTVGSPGDLKTNKIVESLNIKKLLHFFIQGIVGYFELSYELDVKKERYPLS